MWEPGPRKRWQRPQRESREEPKSKRLLPESPYRAKITPFIKVISSTLTPLPRWAWRWEETCPWRPPCQRWRGGRWSPTHLPRPGCASTGWHRGLSCSDKDSCTSSHCTSDLSWIFWWRALTRGAEERRSSALHCSGIRIGRSIRLDPASVKSYFPTLLFNCHFPLHYKGAYIGGKSEWTVWVNFGFTLHQSNLNFDFAGCCAPELSLSSNFAIFWP